MRVGLIPQNVLESLALASGLAPLPVLIGFWGLGAGRTMMAGVRLGVFDALAGGEKSSEELARELGCDPAGMDALLSALTGFGHLKRKDGRYRNGRLTQRWLTSRSPSSLRHLALFFYDVSELLDSVEDAVRGRETTVLDLHDERRPPDFWERYLRSLAQLARFETWEMIRKIPFPREPKSLLDIGGGHGMFSVAFCRHYPTLEAEVLDLPGAVAVGRRVVDEENMGHRVCFREGDLRQTDFGSGRDAIFMFILVHHFSPEELAVIFERAYRALAPGGTLAIFEPEYRDKGDRITQTGGVLRLMFFLTSRARLYADTTLCGWLSRAGFAEVQSLRLLSAPMTVLITARRPAVDRPGAGARATEEGRTEVRT
jgi:SAM-dependent methyltransferase